MAKTDARWNSKPESIYVHERYEFLVKKNSSLKKIPGLINFVRSLNAQGTGNSNPI